jgi:glycosyltransferase involved in cell wall biosynthesis
VENPTLSQTVSVVIPYYNGSRFVADALASVGAQTLPVAEIIVVDDGSRPEEAAALDRAAADIPRCRVIHLERNRGACVARNIGITRSTGTYVAMLDCDDSWVPDKMAKQMAFLAAHPEYRAVHAAVRIIQDDGSQAFTHKTDVTFEALVKFPCPAFPSATVMQREALFECGLFNPTKGACQDLDLFLRFTSQYPIGCVDEPLVLRRIHPQSISRNVPMFWHEADRVYRDYRYVFKDGAAAADTLIELHADFLMRAVYMRDMAFFWKIVRRATRRDVTVWRLLLRTITGLFRNRIARKRRGKSGAPAQVPSERGVGTL